MTPESGARWHPSKPLLCLAYLKLKEAHVELIVIAVT